MSEYCDYCLEEKLDQEESWKFVCKHRICKKCLDENQDRVFECPFKECKFEENNCGLHKSPYIGYCVDDMIPICDMCCDSHSEHELRDIEMLNEDFIQEKNKVWTESYKVLSELSNNIKEFYSKFDNSPKIIEEIEAACIKRVRRIEEGSKLNQVFSEIPNKGLGPNTDLRILDLPIRVELIKYLNNTANYNEEQIRYFKKLQEINELLKKL